MEKHLYVPVGAQGSGKSHLYSQRFSDCVYISQDEQGKQGHRLLFNDAIKEGKNVYIDRINHTREQRDRYIRQARAAGYKTHIIWLHASYELCYERIGKRKNHPSLTLENAHEALTTFFFQFQAPKNGEADDIEIIGEDEQIVFDISKYVKDLRVIVIGDLHGMEDELKLLLKKCSYRKGVDVLLFCGDLIDRGPKIAECLMNYVNDDEHWAYSVMGNHEYKFARYLVGRKVNTTGLTKTIEQTKDLDKNKMLLQVMSFPFCIKFRPKSYVVHAGVNPLRHVTMQYKDELMYTRDLTLNNQTAPWWAFHWADDEIFFGHQVTPEKIKVNENVYAMDGGAVFGMELRACIHNPDGTKEFVSQECKTAYSQYNNKHTEEEQEEAIEEQVTKTIEEENIVESLKPREELVKLGFLSRKVYKDLFLYNYTPKCTYERHWNDVTRASRGVIFDSKTGELVSWTPNKFFNVNEEPETQLEALPVKDGFEVFEKVDGSFVSVSYWEKGNEWIVATRGSFESEQAKVARDMLSETTLVQTGMGEAAFSQFDALKEKYTYIFEVIYPENRHNEGARLVVDYGSEKTLVGLAIFDKEQKVELDTLKAIKEFERIGYRMAQNYLGLEISKIMELQKTLPAQKEGFVVKFMNGLRVKFKTEEYVRMNRILNSMNIKTVWEAMENGKVALHYMMSVPEEIREEAEKYKTELEAQFEEVLKEADHEQRLWLPVRPKDDKDGAAFKQIGLFMKDNSSAFKYPMLVFAMARGKTSDVNRIVKEIIRPKLGE
jgi:RNA ligase